jgi:hypothetical protein
MSANCKRQLLVSSSLSICLHGTTQFPLDDFHEIWYTSIFKKSVDRVKVSLTSDKNNWYFTWRPIYIYHHISILLIMRNVLNIIEKTKTCFIFNKFFLKILPFIIWKNTVQPHRPQMTIWCISIACWICKATCTHSEYIVLSMQQ